MARCIARNCGKQFTPMTREKRAPSTLRAFFWKYCPTCRTLGNAGSPIIAERSDTP